MGKNTQGEALAYNCLGIDTFKTGQYDESIQYHNNHLELADSTGRLIAHTNLGIVFQAMGLSEHAAIHHQHAIEYANRMGAKDAQCFTGVILASLPLPRAICRPAASVCSTT